MHPYLSQFFLIPHLALNFTGTESNDFALRGKTLHVPGSRDTPCRETKWAIVTWQYFRLAESYVISRILQASGITWGLYSVNLFLLLRNYPKNTVFSFIFFDKLHKSLLTAHLSPTVSQYLQSWLRLPGTSYHLLTPNNSYSTAIYFVTAYSSA